jgi:hypothetical protein
MAEYIERSAAIEAAKHAWAKGLEPSQYIETLPAADVAPVVRCKDCKHLCVWNRKDIYAFCPKTNIVFLPFDKDTRTFFCSLGERKDGGDG